MKLPPLLRPASAMAAISLLFGACSSAPPLPAGPAKLPVTMSEYRFSHPPSVPRGRIVFSTRNAGTMAHDLVLLPDSGPQASSTSAGDGPTAVAPLAVLPPQRPGERDDFAQDLPRGTYLLLCLVTDPDGKDHVAKGMRSRFRVS